MVRSRLMTKKPKQNKAKQKTKTNRGQHTHFQIVTWYGLELTANLHFPEEKQGDMIAQVLSKGADTTGGH